MAKADLLGFSSELEAMGLKRRSAPKDAGLIDFAPLCDMTFQLLAFFIMTVQLAGQETVDVPQITHGQGVDLDSAIVFTVLKPLDAKSDAKMLLGNGPEGKAMTIEEARSAIESAVTAGRGNIIIKAEREVPWGAVQQLGRVVASVSGAELFVGVADKE
jgi:biopolymer transport protein ExbD